MTDRKPNMSQVKINMPEQASDVRNRNYEEVSLGYTVAMAQKEATRCLNCKHRPCVSGCPVNVNIPDFISEIVRGNFENAYQTIVILPLAPPSPLPMSPPPIPAPPLSQPRAINTPIFSPNDCP